MSTRMETWCSSLSRTSVMWPSAGVYLDALLRRLSTIWVSRVSSPRTGRGEPPCRSSNPCRLRSMAGRQASTAARTGTIRSTGSLRSAILPLVMRLTSRRSSTSRVRCPTWRSITAAARSSLLASWGPARRMATALRMGARGFRSSWPSMARNSLIRRSATSSSSMRRRAVRSRVTLAKPRRVPVRSRMAVMTTLAQKRVPSLRTRQPSSSNRPSRRAVASSCCGQPWSMASWG